MACRMTCGRHRHSSTPTRQAATQHPWRSDPAIAESPYRSCYRPSISETDNVKNNELIRHFFGGFIRLHILYHAEKEAICGVEMIEELKHHGYDLSPGTLYPILHSLEKASYISCEEEVVSGKRRKNYRITKSGKKLLADAKKKLRELFSEVVEDKEH